MNDPRYTCSSATANIALAYICLNVLRLSESLKVAIHLVRRVMLLLLSRLRSSVVGVVVVLSSQFARCAFFVFCFSPRANRSLGHIEEEEVFGLSPQILDADVGQRD